LKRGTKIRGAMKKSEGMDRTVKYGRGGQEKVKLRQGGIINVTRQGGARTSQQTKELEYLKWVTGVVETGGQGGGGSEVV